MAGETEKKTEEEILKEYDGPYAIIDFPAMKIIADAEQEKRISFSSKIPALDKFIGGFDGGDLVILSGITGEGKTTLAQTITHNLSEQGICSLWLSYEVSPHHLIGKFTTMPNACIPKKMMGNTLTW